MDRFFLLVLSMIVALTSGCGGGSAGTGTGDTLVRIQGIVSDPSGAPVESALVTVVESGDSDTTDGVGAFSIEADVANQQITLEVSKQDRSALTTITAPGESGTISIQVKFDDVREVVETQELSVQSSIVGRCDVYFENFSTIRQANPVEPGTSCVAKISISAGGNPVPHVPIAIQYKSCSKGSAWVTTELGATMSGGNIGIAQIPFDFYDDQKHCIYRIVTPFGDPKVDPIITEIVTLTAQKEVP